MKIVALLLVLAPLALADNCPLDVFECDDGSFVARDPNQGCDFAPFPEPDLWCPNIIEGRCAEATSKKACKKGVLRNFCKWKSGKCAAKKAVLNFFS